MFAKKEVEVVYNRIKTSEDESSEESYDPLKAGSEEESKRDSNAVKEQPPVV